MKTTVYEISNNRRSWMWDSEGETADLAHIEKAFGFLANSDRYYEVEQNGATVLTVKNHRCLGGGRVKDRIEVGDRVRVEFWPMKNDLCGVVLYVPGSSGDLWIIRAEDRVFYVQHFATISKRIESGEG